MACAGARATDLSGLPGTERDPARPRVSPARYAGTPPSAPWSCSRARTPGWARSWGGQMSGSARIAPACPCRARRRRVDRGGRVRGPGRGDGCARAGSGARRSVADAALRRRRDASGPDRALRGVAGPARLLAAAAAGRGGRRQRVVDASAAQHRCRMVHARHRRVAGRARFDEQHVPHQRSAVRELDERFGSPGVLQAETIAQSAERGQEGRAARVRGWARRAHERSDRRLPVVRFRSRCRDELHRAE